MVVRDRRGPHNCHSWVRRHVLEMHLLLSILFVVKLRQELLLERDCFDDLFFNRRVMNVRLVNVLRI